MAITDKPNPSRPLSRRQFLQAAAAAGAVVALPGVVRSGRVPSAPSTNFLTAAEYAIVAAAVARIFPTDTTAGATEAGVADYIQGLLTLIPPLDANCDRRRSAADLVGIVAAIGSGAPGCDPADAEGFTAVDLTMATQGVFEAQSVYAGGPFSNRQPFLDVEAMAPSSRYPVDAFLSFVPLTRVQRIAWRARLDGIDAAPELAGNPLVAQGLSQEVNLRQRYRAGLAELNSLSVQKYQADFVSLTPPQQDDVMSLSLGDIVPLLQNHTCEGMFSAPEYGGNRNRVGWELVGYDGDSQPLGYTWGFNDETGLYVEDPLRPNSMPNPGETCAGFSEPVATLLRILLGMQPGFRENSNPECVEVMP